MPESNQFQSDHLQALILSEIAVASGDDPDNPLIEVGSPDSELVFVQFDHDLSAADEAILDGLVARSADYFIVTSDGGNTDLGNPSLVSKNAGLLSSTTITLQMKNGAGTSINGHAENVVLDITGLVPINKSGGVFDGNGKFAFTVGASLERGSVQVEITAESLPPRTFFAKWS